MNRFCGYCGSVLNNLTGECSNPKCIGNKNNLDSSTVPVIAEDSWTKNKNYKNEPDSYGTFPENSIRHEGKKNVAIKIALASALVVVVIGFFAVLCYYNIITIPFMNNFFVSSGMKDSDNVMSWEDSEYNALQYAGMKIEDASEKIGEMWDDSDGDGKTVYTDGSLVIETKRGTDRVNHISIRGNSKYQIYNISIGMKINSARENMNKLNFEEKNCSVAGMVEFESPSGEIIRLENEDGEVSKILYWEDGKTAKEISADTIANVVTETTAAETPSQTSPATYPVTGFTSASATSILPSQSSGDNVFTYGPENVIDNDPNTCWTEGAQGAGIGEKIILSSDTEQTISGLYINNGYCKSSEAFYNNNRPKEIKIIFDDGRYMTAEFKDGYPYRKAEVNFGESVTTKTVTIEIVDVYMGADQKDTCISDIIPY